MAQVMRLTIETKGQMTAMWQKNPDDPSLNDPASHSKWPAYVLDAFELEEAAHDIDEALRSLVGLDWPDMLSIEDAAGQRPDSDAEMIALARAGQRLRQALLNSGSPDDKTQRVLASLRACFDEIRRDSANGTEWRVEVIYKGFPDRDPRTIPWGLCFETASGEDVAEDGPDPEDLGPSGGFWCQKYCLAVRGVDAHIEKVRAARDHEFVEMALLIEKEAGGRSRIEESLQQASHRTRGAEKANEFIAEEPHAYKQLLNEVVGQKQRDTYIYLSLLSEERLGGKGRIDVPEIKRLRGRESGVVMLVVLDGDAVIRGDRGHSWLENLMAIAENGLIATEVDVDNPALKFFGFQALTHILKSGKPLIKAIHDFRTLTWPIGLIYGVYCNPLHIYVDPPRLADIAEIRKLLQERKNVTH